MLKRDKSKFHSIVRSLIGLSVAIVALNQVLAQEGARNSSKDCIHCGATPGGNPSNESIDQFGAVAESDAEKHPKKFSCANLIHTLLRYEGLVEDNGKLLTGTEKYGGMTRPDGEPTNHLYENKAKKQLVTIFEGKNKKFTKINVKRGYETYTVPGKQEGLVESRTKTASDLNIEVNANCQIVKMEMPKYNGGFDLEISVDAETCRKLNSGEQLIKGLGKDDLMLASAKIGQGCIASRVLSSRAEDVKTLCHQYAEFLTSQQTPDCPNWIRYDAYLQGMNDLKARSREEKKAVTIRPSR